MDSLWPLALIAMAIMFLEFYELLQMRFALHRGDRAEAHLHFWRVIVACACLIVVAISFCVVVSKQ
jgi:anti-sigma-K factor RskA